jgi:hypothetical protein
VSFGEQDLRQELDYKQNAPEDHHLVGFDLLLGKVRRGGHLEAGGGRGGAGAVRRSRGTIEKAPAGTARGRLGDGPSDKGAAMIGRRRRGKGRGRCSGKGKRDDGRMDSPHSGRCGGRTKNAGAKKANVVVDHHVLEMRRGLRLWMC